MIRDITVNIKKDWIRKRRVSGDAFFMECSSQAGLEVEVGISWAVALSSKHGFELSLNVTWGSGEFISSSVFPPFLKKWYVSEFITEGGVSCAFISRPRLTQISVGDFAADSFSTFPGLFLCEIREILMQKGIWKVRFSRFKFMWEAPRYLDHLELLRVTY